jgi:hypothetical protein
MVLERLAARFAVGDENIVSVDTDVVCLIFA